MSEHAFLVAVYRHSLGNPANVVSALKIGEELGLPTDVTKRIVQRLMAEGLIEHQLSGHRISITVAGGREAERGLEGGTVQERSATESRQGIFVSYSHLDARWLERLKVHLLPLKRTGLEIWDDTRIEPSSDWRDEIRRAIERAAVAVLLVSADFIASEFIDHDELPPLLDAANDCGLKILSLILSDSAFERTPLARFHSFNPPSRPLIGMTRREREQTLAQLAATIERWLRR